MKRNVRFIWLLIKLKLTHMMMFRLDFFEGFLADGALFMVQLLAFEAIYGQVTSIGDWSRGQMILFVGTFSMINALNMFIYFFGIVTLPDKIRKGDLDSYITKPVNPLLRLTFENVNLGSFPLVILSAFIIRYGVAVAGISVTPGLLMGYAGLVLLMTLLWYDMELILRTLPFLVLSANGITQLIEHMLELNFKIPGVLYKGALKVFFYFIVPYGIMSTVPTQFLSRMATTAGVLAAVSTVVFFTAFALWFWKFCLKRYKSASS